MDDRSLRVLDFYLLLDILKEYSTSPLGRKRCEALRPSYDPPLIQSRLAEVLELKRLLETLGDPPIRGLKDIGVILRKLEVEDSVLAVEELMDVYHQIELSAGVKRYFQKLEDVEAHRLQEKASRLSTLKVLEKEILHALSPKGEILDRATPALSEIRDRLREARDRAKRVLEHMLHQEDLQPIFQEQLITLRNGRYVLLIKSDYKNWLQGIVHDQSQSRMTFFIEPLQVVSLNNEINILMSEEKEEEFRILAELSRSVREEIQNLWSDFEILGELDLLYAMAKLSIRLKATEPDWNTEGKIAMKNARHPLLVFQKEQEVVPIDLRMGDGIRVLILSGANAGGKTVALKTLGLLTLMVQSGLPIPASEGSEVAFFEQIFAVIGDEQNIEANLSSFSSHLLHLSQILEKAGPRSLVLLDELGVGTDTQEGCALAMGFLDRLREKGATAAVTTHFDRLKVYGYLHPDVENVAVQFDEKTLQPKYALSYGASGLSQAFAIAEKLGVPEKVLERARHYKEGGDQQLSRALEVLEKLKAEVEKERGELHAAKEETAVARQKLKRLLSEIKTKKQDILARAEEKAMRATQKVEEELKEWMRRKKEERAALLDLRRQSLDRREIQDVRRKHFPSPHKPGPAAGAGALKVGDHVRIESLRSDGVVAKVDAVLKKAEVLTNKGTVKTSLSDLVKIEEGKEGEKGRPLPGVFSLSEVEIPEPPSELNVIGLTVEDALPRVDKFIDQALLHGLEKVHIIHGIGSGKLRSAIAKYLAEHRAVRHFGLEEGKRGGKGVTVVELG